MKTNNMINVLWDNCLVGTLAMTPDRRAAFQYSEEWRERGISISPFSLPTGDKVYVPQKTYFDEHTTTVDGNGKNPGIRELVRVGVQAGMNKEMCEEIAQKVQKCVGEMLEEYV